MSTTLATQSPMRCFEVAVTGLERLSPSFLRVSLGGPDLTGFDPCGRLGPRDLRVKLVVPAGEQPVPALDDFEPGWYPRWLARHPHERGEMRTYTIRRHRALPTGAEVDIDVVLHDVAGGRPGAIARWVRDLAEGDRVVLLGPDRHARTPYGGIDWRPPLPTPDRRVPVLLVADETAVPAVGSILETLPSGYVGHAILEVPEPADFQHLRTDADVAITWLARGEQPRGAQMLGAMDRALADLSGVTVDRSVSLPFARDDEEDVWEVPEQADGREPYVWVAGESGVVRGLRRHLVGVRGLPRTSLAFMGYWREGHAVG